MTIYKTQVYLIGSCIGQSTWGHADENALTPPAEPTGEWVSPAFTASEELRVSVKVGSIDWYRTEFTVHNGDVFWRKYNMPNNWAETMGADYSVSLPLARSCMSTLIQIKQKLDNLRSKQNEKDIFI